MAQAPERQPYLGWRPWLSAEFEDAGFATVPLSRLLDLRKTIFAEEATPLGRALVLEGGGTEGFEVDVLLGDAPIDEAVIAGLHHRTGAAEVEVTAIVREVALRDIDGNAFGGVVVAAFDFIGSGFAVTGDEVAAGKGCDGGVHFAAKGVFAGVAGAVAEPDFAPRVVGGEGLEHREDQG